MSFPDTWDWDPFEVFGNLLDKIITTFISPIIDFILGNVYSFFDLINSLFGFITSFAHLGTTIISFISTFLGLFMEDAWTTLLVAQISLIILLRIHFFLKTVKVWGFGI